MIRYLWTNTDSQIPGQGSAAPPSEDSWSVPPVASAAPVQPMQGALWLYEQGEMPLLQAVDDGGWTAFLTAGSSLVARPDGSAWANDELPQGAPVTPNEDWNVLPLIGVPVTVPPPSRMPEYGWHSEERVVTGTAHFPSDDSILPILRVITPPIRVPVGWWFEQNDWWGGSTPTSIPIGGGGGSIAAILVARSRGQYTT